MLSVSRAELFGKVQPVLDSLSKMEFSEELYPQLKEKKDTTARQMWNKFIYAIARNQDFLSPFIKDIAKIIDPTPKYSTYMQKKYELAVEYGDKDPATKQPIRVSINNSPTFPVSDPESKKAYDAKLAELDEFYQDDIKAREETVLTLNDFLNESEEIPFYKIAFASIPKVTGEQLRVLLKFVKEDPAEVEKLLGMDADNESK